MPPITDHPLRYKLANELHARPFPSLTTPCRAVYLAVKQPKDAASRDRDEDFAHLIDLLDRHGTAHPSPGATHFSARIGQNTVKWEQHTEFVTYTVFLPGLGERPFDPADFAVFPQDWLDKAPGVRVTSAMIRVERRMDDEDIRARLEDWLVPESIAVSEVIEILPPALVEASSRMIDPPTVGTIVVPPRMPLASIETAPSEMTPGLPSSALRRTVPPVPPPLAPSAP